MERHDASRRVLSDIGNIPVDGWGSRKGAAGESGIPRHSAPAWMASAKGAEHMDVEEEMPDPGTCPQYAPIILANLREREKSFPPVFGYMERQPDITEKMRGILVDWLIDVHVKFRLHPETLFLTVNLIDRFLSVENVERTNLQLVGVVALFVSSKFEEIFPPEVKDFEYISAKTYKRDEIFRMERRMLARLKYTLAAPTIYQFLTQFLYFASASQDQTFIASQVAESSLLTISVFQPSTTAAAAVFISRILTGEPNPWPPSLAEKCGYSLDAILPCSRALAAQYDKYQNPASRLQAVRKKYSYAKFNQVATKTLCPLTDLLSPATTAPPPSIPPLVAMEDS
eukprot:Sspe_Gene.27501::Locus_11891_Transcript_1_1_Confidence_1.000_Length_1328::g.27501::m.27501/K06627/CCNA; cyclin-A